MIKAFAPRDSGGCSWVLLSIVLVTGLVLERPTPSIVSAQVPVVQKTGDGIERRSGDQGFALIHSGVEVKNVTYTVGAQGTMEASFVDPQATNWIPETVVVRVQSPSGPILQVNTVKLRRRPSE